MSKIYILDKNELLKSNLPKVIYYLDEKSSNFKSIALQILGYNKNMEELMELYNRDIKIGEIVDFINNNSKLNFAYYSTLSDNEDLPEYLSLSTDSNEAKPMTDLLERKMKIEKGIITLETEKDKARQMRDKEFIALDLYDKAVLREDIIETEKDKEDRDKFRNEWLELPNNYSDLDTPIEDLYPKTPEKIKYFE